MKESQWKKRKIDGNFFSFSFEDLLFYSFQMIVHVPIFGSALKWIEEM